MSLIICDARFREVNKPNKFDEDITMILRKDVVEGRLVKVYTPKKFTTKKADARKEVWIKYQETTGGPFKTVTFQESTSAHRSITVNLVIESPVIESPVLESVEEQ